MPRLDLYLAEKGLAPSRSLAARLVREGSVTVNGTVAKKPSLPVEEGARIEVGDSPLTRYVSRGGLKLEAALDAWGIDPEGLDCADIGASTGGFTHVLLSRGARRIYAVDSGTDQLHPTLRERPEVVSLENVNARTLNEGLFGQVDLVVMDVSFISQTLLYPAVKRILKPEGTFVALIKPQFEVGREHLGSGGIVRSEKARQAALDRIAAAARANGLRLCAVIRSPIEGGDGNVEYLAHFTFERKKEERE
ncbi:MAG: TlyA family RNA methyltransferase [Clostridia bacterium]|nr:TlyA family RNA methyltransferase [Clostridia bacterium]